MILFEQEHVKVWYNTDTKQLIQKWVGFASSKEFREAIDVSIDFTKHYNVLSLVCDLSEQQVVSLEDIHYASKKFPRLFDYGVLASAFVIPENIFSQISLKEFANMQDETTVQYFKSREKANKWIAAQIPPQ
jgi:hypothetical protein